MTTVSGIEFIKDFLRQRRPDLADIDHELDLVDSRVVNSLMFVEFLYRLEEVTGSEIPLESVNPDDFRTINKIIERFF